MSWTESTVLIFEQSFKGLMCYIIAVYNLTMELHANSSVLQAIEESRISVIVFSSNFDASTWFFQEMGKIFECRKTIEQRFVPLFYNVDPSYVRYRKGMFGEAFEDLIARSILTKDESICYRKALIEAADVKGFSVMSSR